MVTGDVEKKGIFMHWSLLDNKISKLWWFLLL